MRKFWSNIFSGGGTGPLACLLLALILGLQYTAGIFTMEMAKWSREWGLGEHLLDLGRVAPATLTRPALSLADLAFDARWAETSAQSDAATTPTAAGEVYLAGLEEDLTAPFQNFARQARLYKLALIGTDGKVLYDTLAPERALGHYDFWEIDKGEIGLALDGLAQTAPFYRGPGGRPYKRCYFPVREGGGPEGAGAGPVRAVLCLWAGEDYLAGIGTLGRHLARLNLLLTVLMAGVGLLIHHLIRRARRYERQAAEADRLAGLGGLAAGFAHELRNPLEIIRAFTEDLERGLRVGSPAEESAEACQEIIEEVDRMNRLVGQFLSYSRGESGGGEPGAAAALETTRAVLGMMRHTAEKAGVTLALEAPAGEAAGKWTVGLEAGALKQVLINLTRNAIEASRAGGTVRVALSAGAKAVELRVSDEGAGIAEGDRKRLFEPFFSTRAGGSGLGLAISRQIADRAGGSLKLDDKHHGGASFVLRLPREKDIADCGLRIAD